MTQPGSSPKKVRFGVFEVDLESAELRKQGLRLRLQEQPFQVLAALLEQPGDVVAREDLIRRLWPDGTVVDFDRGLNAAVTRLRQALSDSAEVPRYVETVARRGYRFIAPVDGVGSVEHPAPLVLVAAPRRARIWLAATVISLLALSAAWWWLSRVPTRASDKPLKVVPLTTEPGIERNPSFSPDGNQIVYEWDKGDGNPHVYLKLVGPGDPIRLTSASGPEYGPAWSPNGRQIAFLRKLDASTVGVIVIPALGGVERKVAEYPSPGFSVLVNAHRRLDWTHDSRHLIVSGPERPGGAEGLFLVSIDSGERAWLTKPPTGSLEGDREPAVSPDGHVVAFVRGEYAASGVIHLLPLSADLRPAGEPRILASTGRAHSPMWTPDGREIVFTTLIPAVLFGSNVWRIELKQGASPRALLALGGMPPFLQWHKRAVLPTRGPPPTPTSGGRNSPHTRHLCLPRYA